MPKMCANISRNTVEGLSSLGYTRRKTDNFQRKGWPGSYVASWTTLIWLSCPLQGAIDNRYNEIKYYSLQG